MREILQTIQKKNNIFLKKPLSFEINEWVLHITKTKEAWQKNTKKYNTGSEIYFCYLEPLDNWWTLNGVYRLQYCVYVNLLISIIILWLYKRIYLFLRYKH